MLDHPLIEFIGEINEDEKREFLGKARALLFPIDWPEPFGLVMIESMSAGTPIIAWRRGSVPEIIADGVSGVIVDSIESAVAAVRTISQMSRTGVRAEFERRFTAERMALAYVGAYRALLARRATLLHPSGATLRAAPAFNVERQPTAAKSILETPLPGSA
jgi:glycosyltransferase involved in cell wall biosynthesis